MDVQSAIGKLSKEKRALLETWLQKRQGAKQVIPRQERQKGVNDFPLSYAQERLWFLGTIGARECVLQHDRGHTDQRAVAGGSVGANGQ
jgi:hypothetical protein